MKSLYTYWQYVERRNKILYLAFLATYLFFCVYVTYNVVQQKDVTSLLNAFGGSWLTYSCYMIAPVIPYTFFIFLSGWARYLSLKTDDDMEA